MGNKPCIYSNSHKLLYANVELKLQKANSFIEKQILNEYLKIKKAIYKKRYSPKSNNECEKCEVSTKAKKLSSYLSLEKQRNILSKWLKISFNNIEKSDNDKTSIIEQIESNLINYKQHKEFKLKKLVANGSPYSIRHILWMLLSNINLHDNTSINDLYITDNIDPQIENQIKKDLYRTYFHNETYTKENICTLYDLLKLFAIHNKEIGYCQGMNFIAKFILIITNYNIINAYNLMTFIFNNINGYFTEDFPLLKQNEFKSVYKRKYYNRNKKELPHVTKEDDNEDNYVK